MRRNAQIQIHLPRLLIHSNMLLQYMYRTIIKEDILTDNLEGYIMKMIIIIIK